jgi:Saccharopine dehydrogenase NADP binding domain
LSSNRAITVFGAYGHTGRFIVAELSRTGWQPILSGRDIHKLEAVAAARGGVETRSASLDDPVSLDRALRGAAAVINCAGPFSVTAAPVIEAALRARTPYLDVVAEPEIAAAAFEQYADRAGEAGIVIAPAIGFYGGLGDLLATAAMGGWSYADEITLAYALSSWKPTLGTRATIQAAGHRRGGKRLVFSDGRLELRAGAAPTTEWTFPPPIGRQPVAAEFTTADSVTMSRHLKTNGIREYMTLAPLKDLADPDLSPPTPIDASGRSSQTFMIEAVVRLAGTERRAVASGRDIYAVTAPLVVEAARRVVSNAGRLSGVLAAGQISDARDFLESLTPEHLSLEIS